MSDVHWIEAPSHGRLGIMARPRGGDWLEDDLRRLVWSGVNVIVSLLDDGCDGEFSDIVSSVVNRLNLAGFDWVSGGTSSKEPFVLKFSSGEAVAELSVDTSGEELSFQLRMKVPSDGICSETQDGRLDNLTPDGQAG